MPFAQSEDLKKVLTCGLPKRRFGFLELYRQLCAPESIGTSREWAAPQCLWTQQGPIHTDNGTHSSQICLCIMCEWGLRTRLCSILCPFYGGCSVLGQNFLPNKGHDGVGRVLGTSGVLQQQKIVLWSGTLFNYWRPKAVQCFCFFTAFENGTK